MDNRELAILKCGDCGFCFVDFFNAECNDAMETDWNFAAHAPALAKKFSAYADHIERYVTLAGKTVLDVGAGGGDFLQQAKLRGANVHGIDLDRAGVRFAREAFGISLHDCLLEELALQSESQDILTMWEVLEHLNDPRSTMTEIVRILKPGGWLLLSTPCRDSLWDTFAFMMYNLSFGRIQFPLLYRFSWTHLQIFSRRDIERILSEFGFVIEYYDQRTELTYSTEEYLQWFRPAFFRRPAAFIWNFVKPLIPLGNKMVVYARKNP